jgi:hypothetical protein
MRRWSPLVNGHRLRVSAPVLTSIGWNVPIRVLHWIVGQFRAGWRWARDYQLWRGLMVAAGTVLTLGLLVAIYGPLGDWAGGPTVRDSRASGSSRDPSSAT